MRQGDHKAQLRGILNRLRRWAATDTFAAIQEPGFRDEYSARSQLCALLADLMESRSGRTPADALEVLNVAVQSQLARDREDDLRATRLQRQREMERGVSPFDRTTLRPPPRAPVRSAFPPAPDWPPIIKRRSDPPDPDDAA